MVATVWPEEGDIRTLANGKDEKLWKKRSQMEKWLC